MEETTLRILVLEDDPNDAELEIKMLEGAGIRCEWTRVDTQGGFFSHFDAGGYDLIISDYALPGFNGLDALRLVRERNADIPFILASGTLGEEAAIESLRAGATDYVLKNRISRLVPVVERALNEYAEQKARRLAQRELLLMSSAINQIVESVVITDVDASILYVNPSFEKMTGYRRDEVIGQNPRMLKSDHHDAEFYRVFWESLLRDGWWAGQFVNKKKDGTLVTEDTTISAVRDDSGAIVNYVAVKRDITKEIELEAMVRQSQKMEAVGRLAGGVAHDLNNILQTILGFSAILLMDLEGQEELRADVCEIQQAATRAGNLTRQLLTFSRKNPVMLVRVDLNEIIEEEKKMLERLLGEQVQLAFDPERDLRQVEADRGQIEQVVMNLVVNARDAMPEGGVISVRTRNVVFSEESSSVRSGPFVCISVLDDGVGMNEEVLSHLFEPFFTTKPSGEGTGLGLAVIYGIVDQHKGWIDVESKEGAGSEFKVFLPVCEKA